MGNVSEIYKYLYHYTDQEGLEGILGNQSLWATDYRNLNDEKEIRYFYENKFVNFITPFIENIYTKYVYEDEVHRERFFGNKESLENVVQKDVKNLINSLMKGINSDLFICSFTGEHNDPNINNHGLLSQWRAYGTDGGYCLVFDTEELEKKNESEFKSFNHMSLSLHEIVYSDDNEKYKTNLEQPMRNLSEWCCELIKDVIEKNKPIKDASYNELIQCITSYKHFGFKEEREIRLVSHLVPSTFKYQDKRAIKEKNTTGKKTYIELFKNSETPLPIKKIIVGPHIDKKKRAKELRTFLTNHNIEDIEVTVSDIPYVMR